MKDILYGVPNVVGIFNTQCNTLGLPTMTDLTKCNFSLHGKNKAFFLYYIDILC